MTGVQRPPRDPWPVRAWRRLQPSRLVPRLLSRTELALDRLAVLERHVDAIREALGRIEARQVAADPGATLRDAEFRVYSQWHEDGIVQHLLRRVALDAEGFVEIGIESYLEANTRFLLVERNWRGLVVDRDPIGVRRVQQSRLRWRHDLTAVAAHVTRDNVDRLLIEHGFGGPFGLLSIDVDGVDWWIWEAIRAARPAIVIAEYNWRFGPDDAVTVPYRDDFDRRAADPSLCWFGASLEALCRLAAAKGYELVGCESHGVNAFFVRADLPRRGLPARSAREAFVPGRFVEAHDADGRRVALRPEDECELARRHPLVRIGPDGRAER